MTSNQTCELLTTCKFFIYEMHVESIANRFKNRYCETCKEACAIYMVYSSLGFNALPRDLYPNEYDRALNILASIPR